MCRLLIQTFFITVAVMPLSGMAETANQLPLVDVHRHVQKWISPSKLQSEMEEFNIGWSDGVGAPFGPFSTQPYSDLLKNRYIATIGQVALSDIHKYRGVSGIEDPTTVEYSQMLAEADTLFAKGAIKGFGELILNNEHSTGSPSFQRKAKIDSQAIINIFETANKWGGFVHIHAEDDPESVEQLKNVAAKFPNVPIILAHCLFTANTSLIDGLLRDHENLYCEMSARYASMFSGFFAKKKADKYGWIVFDDKTLDGNWKELIENHPTRFMVGTDTYNAGVNVKKAINDIRNGLLANLSNETARLVASENAIRVMKLVP